MTNTLIHLVRINKKVSWEILHYGRTHGAPFRGYGYVPLRNGGNVVTRMGTQQQQQRNLTLVV